MSFNYYFPGYKHFKLIIKANVYGLNTTVTATRVKKIKVNTKVYIIVRKENLLILYNFYRAKSLTPLYSNTNGE